MSDLRTVLEAARDAYQRRDWPAAREGFEEARRIRSLDVDDLYQLSDAEWWLGHIEAAIGLGEVAFREYVRTERPRQAAMAAMGIAISHFLRGDETVGSGWMSRATRLLADVPEETPEHGYAIYVLEVESQFGGGADPAEVAAAARRVQEIGRRHGDPNLITAGMLGEGRVLIRHGEVARGMALLDEAMVAVLADELSPDWAGNIYCNIMIACHELADHRRAAQWTDATERWLETMPVAVLFRGVCRVHRSQVHQLRGAWERAEQDALKVCDELVGISIVNVAEAWYQVAEIRRLRGDLLGADEAYRTAHRYGRDPQPGLALLRLAQGRVATAAASVESALAARRDRLARAPILAAQVEVALAGNEPALARHAADELADIAGAFGSSGLRAASCTALGSALLAEGEAASALPILQDALARWQALEAPFETAVVRRRLARAYDALGDHDAAQLEREVATTTLTQLGAPTTESRTKPTRDGLSQRELEVLGLVAVGRTNRQVAGELFISEKTVARHLSNIFTKLDLASRTEAAAYAFEHGLTSRGRG